MTKEQWENWKALVAACKNPNTTNISVHGKKRREMLVAMDRLVESLTEGEPLVYLDGPVVIKNGKVMSPERRKYMEKYWREHKAVPDTVLAFGEI